MHSALAKLEAGRRPAAPTETDAVRVVPADPAPALGLVRQALDETRRIWIRYYTASRDAVTERTVDPLRLLVTDGHSYLEAYCHLAGAIRHFRVDRIEEVRLLDEPAQATLWVDSDIPERIFHPDPQIPPVTLTADRRGPLGRRVLPDGGDHRAGRAGRRAAGADAGRRRRMAGPAGALARRRGRHRGPARAGRAGRARRADEALAAYRS